MFHTFVRRHEGLLILLGIFGITLFLAFDMALDLMDGVPISHLIHEAMIMIFCVALILFQLGVNSRQRESLRTSANEIQALTRAKEEFRGRLAKFRQEFFAAATHQFEAWMLTESERDVAILLIQGLSMKEIAENRKSKEATVRQQAASIYRKAGVEGRKELTAFFLEDLFAVSATAP